jgi:hypothetical protein
LILQSIFLFSQEPAAELSTEEEELGGSGAYIIRSIEYHITGKTKARSLEREAEFREGEQFAELGELDDYVARKTQDLHNIRTLDANECYIQYTLGEAETDGTIPVHLAVFAADSLNFIILPEPKYDSNSGFTLSLKARDYNFLGTLSPLRFDIIWGTDDKNRNSLGFLIDSDIPFQAFGFNWHFNFGNEFRYYFDDDDPAYYKSTTGLSMDLPVGFTTFTFGFEQGLLIHEENDEKDDINDGKYHDWYMYSKLYADWKIPTPLEAGGFGKITYIPGVYGNVNYQPGGDVGDYRRGPNGGFNHQLGFEQIDWLGNFRQGLKVSLFNNNDYNIYRHDWDNSVGLLTAGHIKLSPLFGISGRLMYTRWLDDSYDLAGDTIRGYRDDELDVHQRLSLNLDFPFRLIRFVPSEWSGNKKIQYIDFEQHWSPFVDLMMIDETNNEYSFKPEDIITAVGLEIITFPLKWRSFYLRISVGWNLREWLRIKSPPSGINREIFIGFGHFY